MGVSPAFILNFCEDKIDGVVITLTAAVDIGLIDPIGTLDIVTIGKKTKDSTNRINF